MMADTTAPALRRPVLDDIGALAELHARSWRVTYGPLLTDAEGALLTAEERRGLWDRAVGAPEPREAIWLAEADGRPIGLVFSGPSHDPGVGPNVGEIHAIHVEPGLHGRGIGGRLLAAAVADLRAGGFGRATLWVIRENHEARRFYEGHGWRPGGAVKRGPMGDFDGLPVVNEVRYERTLTPDGPRPGT